ncbi:MAG: hypothetical protein Q9174_003785 [Haloplaca sp. 1 TL-2023]
MALSRLGQLEDEDVKLIGMNEVDGLEFKPGSKPCLGTKKLNGCTAIVFLNKHAAVLGHFAPRPKGADPNTAAGDVFMAQNLQKLHNKVAKYEEAFRKKPDPDVVVAFALLPGADGVWRTVLDTQIALVEAKMSKWNVPVKRAPYHALLDRPQDSDEVEVLVDSRGGHVRIYVEDKVVYPS